MARNPVHVRDALPADADVLVGMWRAEADAGARTPHPEVASAVRAVGHIALDPDQRLVVAEVGDEVVGVAYLTRAPLSPIHEETAVRVGHLFVRRDHRRKGVGRELLGVAAAWADEKESPHLMVTVSAQARDANRFLARLGIASVATVRAVPVAALQERLAKYDAAADDDGHLVVERLRTLRRRQAALGQRSAAGAGRIAQVSRAVQTRRPRSSEITIS